MSSKPERPTLQGQRIKTRKRDEKEKFDPTAFRDAIFTGLTESNGDLEAFGKFLDVSGSKLDYRRYAEALFDIIIAGGILAPGGTILVDPDPAKQSRTDTSLFNSSDELEEIKKFYQLIVKLIRRYKYLEKSLEEELNKIVVFLKGFRAEERVKLAKLTALLISGGQITVPVTVLNSTLQDHLVKDGIASEFLVIVLQTWLVEKDPTTVWTSLRKAQVDSKIMDFFPVPKRTQDHLSKCFNDAGLGALMDYHRGQLNHASKRELQNQLNNLIKDGAALKEMVLLVKDAVTKNNLVEAEVSVLVWNVLMMSVEWNKKEELVADQALKHLRQFAPLLAAFTQTTKSELALIVRVQEFCYENMNFLKVFHKIIQLFYKTDVLSEDTIIKWYNSGHSPKGRGVFLDQTKKFVEWLQSAEEESDASE